MKHLKRQKRRLKELLLHDHKIVINLERQINYLIKIYLIQVLLIIHKVKKNHYLKIIIVLHKCLLFNQNKELLRNLCKI